MIGQVTTLDAGYLGASLRPTASTWLRATARLSTR